MKKTQMLLAATLILSVAISDASFAASFGGGRVGGFGGGFRSAPSFRSTPSFRPSTPSYRVPNVGKPYVAPTPKVEAPAPAPVTPKASAPSTVYRTPAPVSRPEPAPSPSVNGGSSWLPWLLLWYSTSQANADDDEDKKLKPAVNEKVPTGE